MRMTHSNRRDICTESAYGQRQTNGHESIRHRKYKIATMKLKIFMFATCFPERKNPLVHRTTTHQHQQLLSLRRSIPIKCCNSHLVHTFTVEIRKRKNKAYFKVLLTVIFAKQWFSVSLPRFYVYVWVCIYCCLLFRVQVTL